MKCDSFRSLFLPAFSLILFCLLSQIQSQYVLETFYYVNNNTCEAQDLKYTILYDGKCNVLADGNFASAQCLNGVIYLMKFCSDPNCNCPSKWERKPRNQCTKETNELSVTYQCSNSLPSNTLQTNLYFGPACDPYYQSTTSFMALGKCTKMKQNHYELITCKSGSVTRVVCEDFMCSRNCAEYTTPTSKCIGSNPSYKYICNTAPPTTFSPSWFLGVATMLLATVAASILY